MAHQGAVRGGGLPSRRTVSEQHSRRVRRSFVRDDARRALLVCQRVVFFGLGALTERR